MRWRPKADQGLRETCVYPEPLACGLGPVITRQVASGSRVPPTKGRANRSNETSHRTLPGLVNVPENVGTTYRRARLIRVFDRHGTCLLPKSMAAFVVFARNGSHGHSSPCMLVIFNWCADNAPHRRVTSDRRNCNLLFVRTPETLPLSPSDALLDLSIADRSV